MEKMDQSMEVGEVVEKVGGARKGDAKIPEDVRQEDHVGGMSHYLGSYLAVWSDSIPFEPVWEVLVIVHGKYAWLEARIRRVIECP